MPDCVDNTELSRTLQKDRLNREYLQRTVHDQSKQISESKPIVLKWTGMRSDMSQFTEGKKAYATYKCNTNKSRGKKEDGTCLTSSNKRLKKCFKHLKSTL